jgi:TonB family protein
MLAHLVESSPWRIRRRGSVVVSLVAHALVLMAAVAAARPVPKDTNMPSRVVPFHPPRPSVPPTSRSIQRKAPPARTDILHLPDGITGEILHGITGEIEAAMGSVGPGTPPIALDIQWPQRVGHRLPSPPVESEAVDREVVPLATNPRPRYPEELRSARIEGSVLARFVVDTAGRVVMGSVTIEVADHPRFAGAVIEALQRWRFRPAESRGRKVPQLVTQPFVFRMAPTEGSTRL